MKEILRLHAKYNQSANQAMIDCLKGLSIDDFNKDMGLYFRSICKTFEHALAVDSMVFANVYANYSDKKLDTASIAAIVNADLSIADEVRISMQTLFEARKKVDDFIIALIEHINDFSKIEVLEFPGIKFEKPIYQFLISVLTHDTHHRGQIAAALDILGIENDFNGMLGV
ncbi:DinB family protein [Helicobacter sp. 13S00477-4]|uniref:DinB family protein n=1 Tax=Helicobacter sp. 13S00477-4 TaxID=1905759 RepID=UPI000BA55628|nr:DinB family protein [Helicobacter sp. 13S00477-4]PAF51629.1 hypothetical protein BKH44_05300 [Helicobacter sp. 13S00477-4]